VGIRIKEENFQNFPVENSTGFTPVSNNEKGLVGGGGGWRVVRLLIFS